VKTIMPAKISDVKAYGAAFPNLEIEISNKDACDGLCFAITATIKGIFGGKGMWSTRQRNYRCYIDLTNFPDDFPEVWIRNVPDKNIKHVNVYHEHYCTRLGLKFPKVCTSHAQEEVRSINLDAVILYLTSILSHQNFSDRARNY